MRKIVNNQTDLSLATVVFYGAGALLVLFSGVMFRSSGINSIWILGIVGVCSLLISATVFLLGSRFTLNAAMVMMSLNSVMLVVLTMMTHSVLGAMSNGVYFIIIFIFAIWFFPILSARIIVYSNLAAYLTVVLIRFEPHVYSLVIAIVLSTVLVGEVIYRFKKGLDTNILTDLLTGAWNKRGLDRVMSVEISNARRSGNPLTVMFIDIDGLKKLNDSKGHREGDRLLREFVETVSKKTRPRDSLARLGGDEFVLVLPETNEQQGTNIGEKLRGLCQCAWSFGVAELQPEESADDLTNRADLRMLEDKRRRKAEATVSGADYQL